MTQDARLVPSRPPLALALTQALMLGVAAIAAMPLTALLAQESSAGFTVMETGRSYRNLQQAVDAIGSGRGSIAIAAGHYRQCAVQEAGEISYLAAEPGAVVFDGVTCEGKAALVLRGRSAEVSGMVFENIAVADYNGAGIRLEAGDLTVAQSWFRNSQQGILTASDPSARLVVDHSTFTGLGTCEGSGGCAHSIYTGNYGHVRITNSRFERGMGGHYVKARAARVDIASSSFDDSAGYETNYMIDLPEGASGQISNNYFVQGRSKENYSAFIAVAAEDRSHSSAGLNVMANQARFAPGISRNSAFVADWSGEVRNITGNVLGEGLVRYEQR